MRSQKVVIFGIMIKYKKGIEIFVAKKQNTIKKRMFLIVFFFHITY